MRSTDHTSRAWAMWSSRSKSLVFTLICAVFSGASCQIIDPPERAPVPFDARALRELWVDLVELTHQDPKRVQERLRVLIPRPTEARSLLRGRARSASALDPTLKEMRSKAIAELPWALDAAIRAGMTDVVVRAVVLSSGKESAPGELALLRHLKAHNGLYTIQMKFPKVEGEPTRRETLRISGWVYERKIGWRCLLKLGDHLEALETSGGLDEVATQDEVSQ